MTWIKRISYSLLAIILLLLLFMIIKGSTIDPLTWNPPTAPNLANNPLVQESLQEATKIPLGEWCAPEDIEVDAAGNLYTGAFKNGNLEEGAVLKITPEGVVSVFCATNSWLAGLAMDAQGNLIGCDQKRGLVSINPAGELTTLAQKDEQGQVFRLINDVDIAQDGKIYFSSSSNKYAYSDDNALKIVLEQRLEGGLYVYHPQTKQVKNLIEGAYFANGVAVSQNDDFVLLVELSRYRILQYWLQGPQKGQVTTFIENLPGLVDGVSRRPDGSFWVGFSTCRNSLLDGIHPNVWKKKMIYGIPDFLQPQAQPYGLIMHLSATGEVLAIHQDSSGEQVREATSVMEHQGKVYLGSDHDAYISMWTF